jgi:hypothetical protein
MRPPHWTEVSRHCAVLAELLSYCGDAEDLSLVPEITAGLDYLLAYQNHRTPAAPASPLNPEFRDAVTMLLQAYEALTGDVHYRLVFRIPL